MKRCACLFLALLAAPGAHTADWKLAGETLRGNRVFVDQSTVADVKGIKRAVVRVEYKEPVPVEGTTVTSMRATALFDCGTKAMATEEVILYKDEATGAEFRRTREVETKFAPPPEGSFGQPALGFVCKR